MSEDGSQLATELWATRHPVAASILSYPEGRAALSAARRAGRLTVAGHRGALEDFESVHGELLVIGIDAPLARRAGELAEELELRGYDAVHLASALAFGPATVMVTWDQALHRAAADVGCAVAPAR